MFPRGRWAEVRKRPNLAETSVYILVGYPADNDDLPTLYIGQADVVGNRIESLIQTIVNFQCGFNDERSAIITIESGKHGGR